MHPCPPFLWRTPGPPSPVPHTVLPLHTEPVQQSTMLQWQLLEIHRCNHAPVTTAWNTQVQPCSSDNCLNYTGATMLQWQLLEIHRWDTASASHRACATVNNAELQWQLLLILEIHSGKLLLLFLWLNVLLFLWLNVCMPQCMCYYFYASIFYDSMCVCLNVCAIISMPQWVYYYFYDSRRFYHYAGVWSNVALAAPITST